MPRRNMRALTEKQFDGGAAIMEKLEEQVGDDQRPDRESTP